MHIAHFFQQYASGLLVLVAICGGVYEIVKSIGRFAANINKRFDEQDKMLLVMNTRFDDHLKQHSGKW